MHKYLQRIKPGIMVLNGDIIDFWQFSKRYWPKHHMKVVKDIINMASKGTEIYYITGNHDETLRKFAGMQIGNIRVVNKLELVLNGQRTCFFHGDVFDVLMKHSRWLEKLGSKGYDSLILVNIIINKISLLLGRDKVSLSKKIKENVKKAVSYIGDFESTAARMAIKNGFQVIVCGHIHHPEIKEISFNESKRITYMNSVDWVENLSALEFNNSKWNLYRFTENLQDLSSDAEEDDYLGNWTDLNNKDIFKMVMKEFQL